MSEQPEDLNAFNGWDSFGATLLLGLVPVALYYVFCYDNVNAIKAAADEAAAASGKSKAELAAELAEKVAEASPDVTFICLMVLGAVLVSLAVLGLALITRWRIIGTLVNLAGAILTPVYIVVLVCHWLPDGEKTPPIPQEEKVQPVAPGTEATSA